MDNITEFLNELENREKDITENKLRDELYLFDKMLDDMDKWTQNHYVDFPHDIQAILIEKTLEIEFKLHELNKEGV
jgi:hypothetical protein